MELLFLLTALFATDNAEFFKTATEQKQEGYTWSYVGKQKPDGSPAIIVSPPAGDNYILYKLTK